MSLLQNSNAISEGGYNIANSLRFQSASSQYLSRTPASAGNRTTWTWSGWVKRGILTTRQDLFGIDNSNVLSFQSAGSNGDSLTFELYNGAGADYYIRPSAVYRDPSAWYHVVAVWDSSNATASDRQRLYVNGERLTAITTGNAIPLNALSNWNSTNAHSIGRNTSGGFYFDGYLTEVNFIDGQALTPSSFGETNTLTGQWVAKKYTGTYGTNGFYLPFSNGTSTTTLGYDSSGNSNNWTLNNFTRSAGVSDCWMNDVPSGNGSSVGGTQPNSNYTVLNPLGKSSTATVTNGNLTLTNSTLNTYPAVSSSIFVSTGKWYFETTYTGSGTAEVAIGLSIYQTLVSRQFQGTGAGTAPNTTLWNSAQGIFKDGTLLSATPTFTFNDVIGVAYDADAGTVTYYKNGTAQTPVVTGITGSYAPTLGINYYNNGTLQFNAGQRSFAYTPPSGFKALCTANLPAATIKKGNTVFDATLYTGNATARSITNAAGFAPDMVWVKARSSATDNYIWDTVRGNFGIVTNSTATEFAGSQVVPNSTGFALENSSGVNANGTTYVGWQWDAGSSTVTNTNGSISSQVRANFTAGVSVVTYTGNGANATVGHGLGVAPSMIIVKGRNYTGDVQNWMVYHKTMTATSYMYLNLTNSKETFSTMWNNTSPTATVFSIGTNINVNANTYNYVAYCFAEIAGFSKFGSYTGNGSADGTFVYTGFRPRWIMAKRTDVISDWVIYDTARDTYNAISNYLFANTAGAEAAFVNYDFLSNGFKCRASTSLNVSGGTYIYACFAESPFASSNAR